MEATPDSEARGSGLPAPRPRGLGQAGGRGGSTDAGGEVRAQELAPLPDPVGVAGAVVGVLPEGLLVAGGANFPGAPPWEGGAKVYHDRVHLLGEDGTWRTLEERLPEPRAYGVSVSTPRGVVVAGGHDAGRVHDSVLRLSIEEGRLVVEELATLPEPRTNAGGALLDGVLHLVGGQSALDASPTADHLALDLTHGDGVAWSERPPVPGGRRSLPVVAALGSRLLVASGRDHGPLREAEGLSAFGLHEDLWLFDPATSRWELPRELGVCVMGAASAPVAGGGLWLLGGDDGVELLERVRLERAGEVEALRRRFLEHEGFREVALRVDLDGAVVEERTLPAGFPVTTTAVRWRGRTVVPSGEVHPGVRTPRVLALELEGARPFGALNWTALGLYLAGMLAIGLLCRRRIHDAEDFFLAGRRIPGWAAGLSIFGTQLSAITFMAVPATAYGSDWSRMVGNLTLLLTLPVAALVFVPAFRRANLSTAYELLGRRFGPRVRRMGATLFVLVQLGRMGIVLYLPAVALSAATGIDEGASIVVMGVLATAYTVLGGFEAVVWTDVAQVVVLLGGAVVALVVAVAGAGGLEETLELAREADRLRLARPGFGLDEKTLPTMLLGTLVLNLVPYTSDQTVVQRYLATPDEASARRGLWINMALTVPAALVFYGLGTALFAYYRTDLGAAPPETADHLVPWFVVRELPGGLAGLVVAAIFAASMSSLDSSMNSVATVLHHDFGLGRGRDVGRGRRSDFRGGAESDAETVPVAGQDGARAPGGGAGRAASGGAGDGALAFGRGATLALGVLGTGAALLVAAADVRFLFDLFNQLLGFFGGALGGVFVLAVLRPRTSPLGAGLGLAAGAVAAAAATAFLVQAETPRLDGYLVGAVGMAVTLLLGFLIPARPEAPAGGADRGPLED